MPAVTDIDQAVALITARLAADPEAARTLLPGFVICPVRAAPAGHLPKARQLRSERWATRVVRVHEAIKDQLDINPAITEAEIAAALNQGGHRTYNGYPFTVTRVRAFTRKHPR